MAEMSQVIERWDALLIDQDGILTKQDAALDRASGGNPSVEIDHADSSPIAVADGVPQVVEAVLCTETFGTSPDFELSDGATGLFTCPLDMAVGDVIDLHDMAFDTDLDVVIADAGAAGKIRIIYRNQ